ncbi:hypothetical protein [Marinisporobacter balticus]|uniref:Uncharacterized protein n=1 Tax=Marinisporobacter balticus TaxID=2018667 RepID=A0A4V2S9Y8_9FIRM|nr:hypothetical protein [Marinisporobacter balticus]TCO69530.1 hypothetical protein EV214_13154 [Marinisporobacter balticus]
MSANPYKILDKVDGDTIIYCESTKVMLDQNLDLKLIWETNEGQYYLTLDSIYEQVKKKIESKMKEAGLSLSKKYIPFIRVSYETGLWGVIFEIGNYGESQWIVHGITKGYA